MIASSVVQLRNHVRVIILAGFPDVPAIFRDRIVPVRLLARHVPVDRVSSIGLVKRFERDSRNGKPKRRRIARDGLQLRQRPCAAGEGRHVFTASLQGELARATTRTIVDADALLTEALTLATHTFDSETYAALLAATLEHPDLACETPCLLHGAIGPARILVTSGESIQLEALTCPGPIVAGDPLLDVATALLPSQPAAFRQGFLEGYAAVGPLDQSQRLRLRRLGVLAMLANAATQPDPAILANLPALVRSELRMIGG